MSEALRHIGDNDYELDVRETSVWVQVGNISVYIRRTIDDGPGVVIETYPIGQEMNSPLSKTIVFEDEMKL